MPCHAAASPQFTALSPDMPVEEALALMKKNGVETAIVLDEDGKFEGTLSHQIIMKNILPVSVAMSDGVRLDVQIRAAPGVAKRLNKINILKVSDLMQRKVVSVGPETPLWEGVSLLVQYGEPLLVMDEQTQKVIGLMNGQTALDELNRLKDS